MAPRPTEFPRWATGGTAEVTAPSEEEKDSGHIPQTILHAALANWLQKLVYDWLLYLDGDRVSLTTAITPSQAKPGTAAAVGVATEAARADHVHDVPSGAPAALTVGGTQVPGTAATVSRSDHVHAMPGVATTAAAGFFAAADKVRLDSMATSAAALTGTAPTQITVTTAASGGAGTAARADHVHSVATAAPASLAVGGTNVPGASASLARADHVHATPAAGTPVALTLAGANAPGGAATVALSDHVHALPATAAPVTLTVAGVTAPGIAATLARSDHVHGMPGTATIGADGFMSIVDKVRLDSMATGAAGLTGTAPTQISVTTAAVGSDTAAAKGDHVHSVSTGTPVAVTVGGTNVPGGATSLARSDHQHALVAFGATAGTLTQGNDARLSDDRTASGLRTATTVVATSAAAAPSAGQVLTASGGAAAAWANPLALSSSTPAAVGASGVPGVSAAAAHSDHVHAHGDQAGGTLHATATTTVAGFLSAVDKVRLDGMAAGSAALTDAAPTQITVTTAAVGDGTAAARDNHVHSVATAAPSTLAAGGTNTPGSSASLARADHVHALPAFGSTAGTFAEGSDARLTNDRTASGLRTAGTVVAVSAAAAPSIGAVLTATSTTAASWQAPLALSNATPAVIGSAAPGVGAAAARDDHVHSHGAQTSGTLHAAATTSVAGFLSTADKTRLDAMSLDFKESCRVATTTNPGTVTSAAPNIVDGVTLAVGNRVLNKSAGGGVNGGIWTVVSVGTGADGVWARATDADTNAKVTAGMVVFVTEGTVNSDTGWILTPNDPINVGSTALNFERFTFTTAEQTKLAGIATSAAALTSTAPASVGTANALGAGTTAARSDHVHAHGAQTDGALHAVATSSVAGFMSALDKLQFDLIRTGTPWGIAPTPTAPAAGFVSVLQGPGSHAVTFPASPANGDKISVVCVPGTVFDWTVSTAPRLLRDPLGTRAAATSLSFDSGDGSVTWMYAANQSTWEVVSSYQHYHVGGVQAAVESATSLELSGPLFMSANAINNLPAPTSDDQAANKGYVDITAWSADPSNNGFRLAPTTDDSIPADGAFSTIYLAPVKSNRLALYYASAWRVFQPASVSYALASRTAALPFDLFAYYTGSVVALEIINWSTATTRATSLVRQDGVLVKNGDITRRYLGTVRPRSATTYRVQRANDIDIGSAGIDIWNVDNRRQAAIMLRGANATYAWATASWRQANASGNAQIDVLTGVVGDTVSATVHATANTSSTGIVTPAVGIGLGSTTTPSSFFASEVLSAVGGAVFNAGNFSSSIVNTNSLGVLAYTWLELGGANVSFLGYGAGAYSRPGMSALVWG